MPPHSSLMRSGASTMPVSTPVRNVTVINCWSAPRSRSTALLYSFEARSDCVALDEPLHRLFISNRPNMLRPYRQNLIDGTPPEDEEESTKYKWPRELIPFTDRLQDAIAKLKHQPEGVVFCKHLSKHASMYDRDEVESLTIMYDLDSTVRITHRHVLLLRDPVAILASWDNNGDVHGNSPCVEQVGIVPMLSIYESTNSTAFVDSDELVANPASILADLCQDVGIVFTTEMLSWKSGPHECDGPWAPWWYKSLHKTTGWAVKASSHAAAAAAESQDRSVAPMYMDTLMVSMPAYNFLKNMSNDHASRRQGARYKENMENARESTIWMDDGPGSINCRV